MEKTKITVTGIGDFGFFIMITVLIIFCSGDPDLLDAIIKYVLSLSGN